MARNFLTPPHRESFQKLLDFIFQHGVGNELDHTGLPQPWTAESLEVHADHLRVDISSRALEGWRSGKVKPQVRKLHALSRIVSRDRREASLWAKALIDARNVTFPRAGGRLLSVEGVSAESGAQAAQAQPIPAYRSQSEQAGASGRTTRYLRVGAYTATVFCAGLVTPSLIDTTRASVRPDVLDFRICNNESFDDISKTCLKDERHFPNGVKELRLSFDLRETDKIQEFTRNWYFNSMLFHQFTSYNDSVWPGWTFFNNEAGWPNGDYAIRIIVDGRLHTYRFKVGRDGDVGYMDDLMIGLKEAM